MNRREALSATIALFGGTLVGSNAFLSGCSPQTKEVKEFTNDLVVLLDDVGETIIPTTSSSPGARAARIGEFMKVIVTECYSPSEQKVFFDGISRLISLCNEKYRVDFISLTPEEKHEFLFDMDKQAKDHERNRGDSGTEHFFTMLKQLTIWGYFSSEPGATQALRFVPIPGRYDGCIDYVQGEGAWIY